jgi:hypothetical protein
MITFPVITTGAMQTLSRNRLNFDRRFYLGASVVALGLVFWGFAHTYYLKLLFGTPTLTTRLHVHGAVMSAWLILFFVQTFLVSAGRVSVHRRLGIAGISVAVLVVALGTTTTFNAAAREVGRHSAEASMRVTVLGLELVQMALFAGFVAIGIAMRRRPGFHKRFMMLATACMIPSAFSRIPLDLTFMVSAFVSILILSDVFVIACVAIDFIRHRRLHPAFGWGALVWLGSLNLGYAAATSSPWHRFGTWLVSRSA